MTLSPDNLALGVGNCRRVDRVVADVVEAEGRGVPLAFIAEDIGCYDAFQLAALAAARTQHIRLAIGVTNPYTRHPAELAMSAATLGAASGGRAILGLGSSSPSIIAEQLGIPYGKRVAVMGEAIRIVRALLAGEPAPRDGRHFPVSDFRLAPTVSGHQVPIYLAATGPQMLRLAGRLADGVLLNTGTTPAYVRWAAEEIAVGRRTSDRPAPPKIAVWVPVYLDEDREAGLARARRWTASMLSIPRQGELLLEKSGLPPDCLIPIRQHYHAYPHRGDLERAAREVPDEVVGTLAVVTPPADLTSRLEPYVRAGADVLVVGPRALWTALKNLGGAPQ